jgi:hypothetical protein
LSLNVTAHDFTSVSVGVIDTSRVMTSWCTGKGFREIVILLREIWQMNIAKFREKIAQNFAKLGQLCELDPGHVSNQFGQQ